MIFLLAKLNFIAYPLSCFEKWKQSIFSGLSFVSGQDFFVYLITELIKSMVYWWVQAKNNTVAAYGSKEGIERLWNDTSHHKTPGTERGERAIMLYLPTQSLFLGDASQQEANISVNQKQAAPRLSHTTCCVLNGR